MLVVVVVVVVTVRMLVEGLRMLRMPVVVLALLERMSWKWRCVLPRGRRLLPHRERRGRHGVPEGSGIWVPWVPLSQLHVLWGW